MKMSTKNPVWRKQCKRCDSLRRPAFLSLCLGLLFSMAVVPGVCRAETVVIPVHYRSGAEVLPIVKGILSPSGSVTFADSVHSLVVMDTAASIQQVRTFLGTFDKPPQQVRIRLKFQEKTASQDRAVAGHGKVSGKEWSISTGGKAEDGIEIRADDRKGLEQRSSEHLLVTTSGSPAYFFTGIEVPYKQRWIDFCRQYASCPETVEFRRIETGMEILPVIVGERANIEITPRISRLQTGDPQGVIRFTRSSARLSIPLGQWVEIGGTQQAGNEVLSAIIGSGSGKEHSSLSMLLMVETLNKEVN
jgi:type II secretory pathway component GspD/PulD (secretin)